MPAFQDTVYEQIRLGTIQSADALASMLVRELAAPRGVLTPKPPFEVLDVGCGEGWWSAALARQPDVSEVISIDQSAPDVTAPGVTVQMIDLERGDAVHLAGQAFDVVLCLEVAEHVSAPAGDSLVAMLCRLVKPNGIVAFSAAVPGQGGHGHLNEQWPAYWDARFREHGWMLADPWRDRIWSDPRVEPWYAQNLLCAVAPAANGTHWATGGAPRALIHPAVYQARLNDVAFWREDALKWKARAEAAEKWQAAP
jgi:SAM-dependent methyltransferase